MANPLYTKPRVQFGEYQQISPQWSGTPQHQPKVLVPGGGHLNALAFTNSSNATPVTLTAAAAAAATSITVREVASPIPSGTILDFIGAGKFAKLTAAAAKGATTLTVEALPQALVANDSAYYSAIANILYIQSGTLVGRTYAERDAGIGYSPFASTDEEAHLLFFDVHNALVNNEAELYMAKSNNVVYENFLPNWTNMPPDAKTFIRNNYNCIIGVA